MPYSLSNTEIEQLRDQHYNATVSYLKRIHDDLAILRVRHDDGRLSFDPGQYTVLGLGYWEPRLADTQPETLNSRDYRRLVRRAYSISSRLLDEQGRLIRATASAEIEFYVALVRRAPIHSPALTPRMFLLNQGDRLHMGIRAHGRYTLDRIQPTDNVIFCATGTGEAPHNAMISELLSRNHQGKIVSVVSVRHRRDLAYLEKHRRLEIDFDNYRYLPMTTREPENLDVDHEHFVGKRYIQDYFNSNELQTDVRFQIAPESAHVYLCGNPAMVGLPQTTEDHLAAYPEPIGMVELLERRGFRLDHPHTAGNIHVEQYW